MKEFYVFKESGTFSDTLECLGLTSILQKIFNKIDLMNLPEILIEDKGGYFQVTCEKDIVEEDLKKCGYFDFFQYIANKNDKKEELDFDYIDYEKEKEIKDKFFDKKNRNDKPEPLHPDYYEILMLVKSEGYKTSFLNCREWNNHDDFGFLLLKLFEYYSSELMERDSIITKLNKYSSSHKLKLKAVNALQIINPEKGKGVNREKANSIKPDSYKRMNWLEQLIRFSGVRYCLISRYVGDDTKTYAIVPSMISTEYLSSVYSSIKKYRLVSDSIKLDIILLQLLVIELIRKNQNYNAGVWTYVKDKISGMQTAYYKKLSQFTSAVTNIGFLGLPHFVKFNTEEDGNIWIDLWEEHKTIVNTIDEKDSSHISMLQNYRQFLSASDFDSFFDFQFEYASFLIRACNDNKFYIKSFNLNNLEVLMATSEKYSEIIKNVGFISIASAIRNSTIIPIIFKEKKDVIFGLNQKIKIASRTKDSLLVEISEFIQKYNETMMLKDYHSKVHKKYVTTEEYEEFCKLFDKDYSSKLIAGLLVAYGYAKEPSKDTPNDNNNNQNINGENND